MSKCHNGQYIDMLAREEFMSLFFRTLQTLPDIRNSYVPDGPMQDEFYASELSTHKFRRMYTREFSRNPNSSTIETDWSKYYNPTACVIAHQYYFPILVFSRFHSRQKKKKKKRGVLVKMLF